MQRTSDYQNELGDFIERCVLERCGDRELPVLSVTKEYAMVHQSERFEATVVSRDKSNYIVAPRGYLVQGIHIDESNFGIQNLVDEGIVSPAYKLWRFKNQDCIPELIEYYLRSEMAIKYFKRHFLGSTVPRRQVIKKDDFLSMPLNLPEKRIQERYFAFFQQADKSKFSDFKSRFIEQFDSLKKTALSEIAADWDKGQAFKKECIVNEGNTPCIHYGELFKYGSIIDTILSWTNESPIKSSAKGDILFPASDVTPNGLARCSALMSEGVLLGGDIIVLRLKSGFIPEFVSYAINMQKDQLIRRVTGSVVRHMSAKSLNSVEIPIPAIADQKQFIDIIRQADKSKYLN